MSSSQLKCFPVRWGLVVSWLEISQYMRSTLLRDTDMIIWHIHWRRGSFVDHLLIERGSSNLWEPENEAWRQKAMLVDAMMDVAY